MKARELNRLAKTAYEIHATLKVDGREIFLPMVRNGFDYKRPWACRMKHHSNRGKRVYTTFMAKNPSDLLTMILGAAANGHGNILCNPQTAIEKLSLLYASGIFFGFEFSVGVTMEEFNRKMVDQRERASMKVNAYRERVLEANDMLDRTRADLTARFGIPDESLRGAGLDRLISELESLRNSQARVVDKGLEELDRYLQLEDPPLLIGDHPKLRQYLPEYMRCYRYDYMNSRI